MPTPKPPSRYTPGFVGAAVCGSACFFRPKPKSPGLGGPLAQRMLRARLAPRPAMDTQDRVGTTRTSRGRTVVAEQVSPRARCRKWWGCDRRVARRCAECREASQLVYRRYCDSDSPRHGGRGSARAKASVTRSQGSGATFHSFTCSPVVWRRSCTRSGLAFASS